MHSLLLSFYKARHLFIGSYDTTPYNKRHYNKKAQYPEWNQHLPYPERHRIHQWKKNRHRHLWRAHSYLLHSRCLGESPIFSNYPRKRTSNIVTVSTNLVHTLLDFWGGVHGRVVCTDWACMDVNQIVKVSRCIWWITELSCLNVGDRVNFPSTWTDRNHVTRHKAEDFDSLLK